MQTEPTTMQNYKMTWLKQSGNLLVGDMVGTLAEAGVVTGMYAFDRMFPLVPKVVCRILDKPLTYLQPNIESALSLTKNFEGADYYEQRIHKSKEERLQSLCMGTYHYGAALGVGFATMIGTERMLSRLNSVPHIPRAVYAKDGTIHLGLIVLMGMPFMSGATQKIKDVVKCVSKSFGADEAKAEDIARITVFSAIPNHTTFAIITSMLHGQHKSDAIQHALQEYKGIGR